jgi:hypothetical protein
MSPLFFLIPSIRMRCMNSPTSCPHHRHRQSRQSPRIDALCIPYLARCNNFYRRSHWSIATGYDLLNSHRHQAPHCQQDLRHHPTPLPLLPATPEDMFEEILVPLLCAMNNFLTSTMVPPPPRANPPLLSNHNQEITPNVPRSSGVSIFEVQTVTDSQSPSPFHKI